MAVMPMPAASMTRKLQNTSGTLVQFSLGQASSPVTPALGRCFRIRLPSLRICRAWRTSSAALSGQPSTMKGAPR